MLTFIFRFIKFLIKWFLLFTIIPISIYMIFGILITYNVYQGFKEGLRTI